MEDLSGNEAHIKEAREKNLAFQVRRVGTKSELRESGLTFQQNNSLISLPKSIFNENSPEAVSVVNVVYDTLSSILVGLNTTVENLSTNATLHHSSKIISSTVKPLGKEVFEQPVKIVLETNGTVRKRGT